MNFFSDLHEFARKHRFVTIILFLFDGNFVKNDVIVLETVYNIHMIRFQEVKEAARRELPKNLFNFMWVAFVLWLSRGQNLWAMASVDEQQNIVVIYHPLLVKLFESTAIALRIWLLGGLVGIWLLFFFLILHPLEYGCRSYLRHRDNQDRMVSGFGKDYWRIVMAYMLRDVYILAGFLLFVLPGILNVYRYYFLPETLEDHPEMNVIEIMHLNRDMMDGRLIALFAFDISFIGWDVLGWLLPIVQYCFVHPYRYLSREIMYDRICKM